MNVHDVQNNLLAVQPKDSIMMTVGNTSYIVEQVYNGKKTIQEIISDFLERKIMHSNN